MSQMKRKLRSIYYLTPIVLLYGCFSINTLTAEFTPDDYANAIVENLPAKKDQLFIHANRWLINRFENAKSVIQYTDKEAGVIVGKLNLYYKPTSYYSGYVSSPEVSADAIVEINVKDGKARIQIKPLGGWTYDVLSEEKIISGSEPKKYIVENNQMREVNPSESSSTTQEKPTSYGYSKKKALAAINALADDFVNEMKKPISEF